MVDTYTSGKNIFFSFETILVSFLNPFHGSFRRLSEDVSAGNSIQDFSTVPWSCLVTLPGNGVSFTDSFQGLKGLCPRLQLVLALGTRRRAYPEGRCGSRLTSVSGPDTVRPGPLFLQDSVVHALLVEEGSKSQSFPTVAGRSVKYKYLRKLVVLWSVSVRSYRVKRLFLCPRSSPLPRWLRFHSQDEPVVASCRR